jgi:ABC-type amino acid transport substrate-binding protein
MKRRFVNRLARRNRMTVCRERRSFFALVAARSRGYVRAIHLQEAEMLGRKLLTGFVLAITCMATAALAQQAPAQESILQKVQRTKVIHAGYIPYPPFVTVDPNTKKLSGYFIELMDAIVDNMGQGIKIEYEETTWGTMVVGAQSGKFDVVVSGVLSTIPRSMQVTFTRPVLLIGLSAVAKAGDNRFKSEADLRKPGLTIAVTAGEIGHSYAQKYLPGTKLTVLDTPDITRPMLEVLSGHADIGIADSISVSNFVEAHKGQAVNVFAEHPLFVYGCGLLLPRDLQWKDFIDQAIDFLEYSKVLDRLEQKYKKGQSEWISLKKNY